MSHHSAATAAAASDEADFVVPLKIAETTTEAYESQFIQSPSAAQADQGSAHHAGGGNDLNNDEMQNEDQSVEFDLNEDDLLQAFATQDELQMQQQLQPQQLQPQQLQPQQQLHADSQQQDRQEEHQAHSQLEVTHQPQHNNQQPNESVSSEADAASQPRDSLNRPLAAQANSSVLSSRGLTKNQQKDQQQLVDQGMQQQFESNATRDQPRSHDSALHHSKPTSLDSPPPQASHANVFSQQPQRLQSIRGATSSAMAASFDNLARGSIPLVQRQSSVDRQFPTGRTRSSILDRRSSIYARQSAGQRVDSLNCARCSQLLFCITRVARDEHNAVVSQLAAAGRNYAIRIIQRAFQNRVSRSLPQRQSLSAGKHNSEDIGSFGSSKPSMRRHDSSAQKHPRAPSAAETLCDPLSHPTTPSLCASGPLAAWELREAAQEFAAAGATASAAFGAPLLHRNLDDFGAAAAAAAADFNSPPSNENRCGAILRSRARPSAAVSVPASLLSCTPRAHRSIRR